CVCLGSFPHSHPHPHPPPPPLVSYNIGSEGQHALAESFKDNTTLPPQKLYPISQMHTGEQWGAGAPFESIKLLMLCVVFVPPLPPPPLLTLPHFLFLLTTSAARGPAP